MALTNVALFGGCFLTPVIVGKMTFEIGWPWTFYFLAIFMGLMLPVVVFFVPETAFKRADHLNTDMELDFSERKSIESQSSTSRTAQPSARGVVTESNIAKESTEASQQIPQRTPTSELSFLSTAAKQTNPSSNF